MSRKQSVHNWISLSDMMTGLMLVFLFLSVLAIHSVYKREEENRKLAKKFQENRVFVKGFVETTNKIYRDLDYVFKDKYEKWNMELDRNLTIRFKDPEVLFGYKSAVITPRFAKILEEFVPLYLSVINKPEYKNSISEVRIEGHTAAWPDYMYSIRLSQERSNAVLSFILNHPYYQQLPQEDKSKLKFWITANGLGNGRTLDEEGNYTYLTKKPISAKSRRVEFRIVTNKTKLLDEIFKKYNVK